MRVPNRGDWVIADHSISGRDQEITQGNEYYVHNICYNSNDKCYYVEVDADDDQRRFYTNETFRVQEKKPMSKKKKHYARCIDRGNYKLTEGKVYEILEVKQESGGGRKFYTVLNDVGKETSPYASRFEYVEKPVDIKPPADQGWREYDFAIRSYDQIDEGLIAKDLSIQEPMMVLESDERPGYYRVFLHESIWTKADNSGPTFETSWQGHFVYKESRYTERLEFMLSDCGHGYAWVPQRFLASLIRLVKEIKNADWNEGTKANCKVRRIKI